MLFKMGFRLIKNVSGVGVGVGLNEVRIPVKIFMNEILWRVNF